MSEQLLLINPRRRRRTKNSRRRRARNHRRHRRHVARNHRRYHRRARAVNPIRRHRRHHVRNHRRRRHHRNPLSMSGIKGMVMPALIGAGGAVLMDIAYGYISPMLPTSITGTPYINAAVKAAGAVGLGLVASKIVGKEKGTAVAIGALTVIAAQLLQSLIQSSAPTIPFAGLAGIGAYMPSPGPSLVGLHGLGAYMPSRGPSLVGLHGFGTYNPAPYLLPGPAPATAMAGVLDNPGMSDSMF